MIHVCWNRRRPWLFALAWLMASFPGLAAEKGAAAVPKEIDFQRDVRPILARSCFKCHGPDDKGRKAGLRLDIAESAMKPAKSGDVAIVPGKPDQSELIHRIFSTDADEMMPPPELKQELTGAQKDILKRWVAGGAVYRPHWAFVPPRQAPLPKVKQKGWVQNPIDNFVLARLEKEGLKPSPPADDYTLVRRLYLDLIGVPPTPEETDAFVQSAKRNRHAAIERLVDQLLASPHYGERWGRRWLDLARYADTNGYEKDRQRSVWPWRDWVIKSINADLPFDQFTVEQIAGDLLPKPTLDDLVATGFHRNTMLNEEGGIDPLEFRYYAMTDRIAVTGITWLGLTLQCAQCHTHKYDPIPHREYFQMMAFLDNAEEPEIELPDAAIMARRKAIEVQVAELTAKLADKFPPATNNGVVVMPTEHLEQKLSAWLERERGRNATWTTLRPAAAKSNLLRLTTEADGAIFVDGDITKSDTYELKFRGDLSGVRAIRVEALPDERLPANGPGLCYYEGPKGDFFMGEFQLFNGSNAVKIASATESYSKNNFGNSATAKLAMDGDPQTGWSCAGRYGERHEAVFVLEQPLEGVRDLDLKMMFGRHYACPLGKFRISVTRDDGAVARDLPEDIVALLRLPDASLNEAQRTQLRRQFLHAAPELAPARAEIEKLRKTMPAQPTALVFKERSRTNPRATFIHNRGEYLQPTEQVQPAVLSVLNPLPKGAANDRLAFAKWLVSKENPLTARVTVNRQWQTLFGRGIVRTTEDFGLQGDAPTHPELLDWLAVEFQKQGWSLKKLHKLIVTSATYQQSSRVTPELLAKDPENLLLARAPRVRLEAEMIRDGVLRASGLLSKKVGGPSVFPPQPAGVTQEGTYGKIDWKVSEGEDRYRRGLYTFSKRTAPYAMFNTFDGPTGESCLARREVSNTPLQALTLLNDLVFVEAAQALGRELALRPGTEKERVAEAFRRCLSRPPTVDEVNSMLQFYLAQKQRFASQELKAETIAGKGEGDVNERAAWTTLARALFNLDETVTKG